jgi:GT2 family glycosyltransferase
MLGLIARSRAYVGNDSGPMHCAGALDVPVVARFGGGHWPRFLPLATRSFTATQKLPCFGCAWQCWLDEPECLTGVEAKTILDGFDWLLSDDAAEQRVDLGAPLDARWAKLFGAAEQSTRRLMMARAAPQAAPVRAAQPASVPGARRPKVFVVTPSFNQALYLRETIESVLAQDYDNLDYLVMDGGSTDGSVDILRSYGDRVRWVSGPDGGQAAAIARAWSETDADIVAWLNSDDTYLPEAVSKAVAFLESSPDAAMLYGEAWHTDASGRRLYPYPTKPFDRDALAAECFICQPATFIRRDVFKIVRMPDPELRYCMDYDLWIRISRHFHVGQVGAFLATSRLHLANKSLGEREGLLREAMEVSRKHFGSLHPRWKLVYADYRMERIVARLWPLPAPVHSIAARWMGGRIAAAPFGDGWARPRTILPITCDQDGWMSIDADMPFWPYRRPLLITASYEGRVLASRRIAGPGNFTITVRVPPDADRERPLHLDASQSFFPFQVGSPADRRALSFHILGVRAGRAAGVEDQKRADRWRRLVGRTRFMPAIVQRAVLASYARLVDDPVEGLPYLDGWAGPRTAVDVGRGAGGEDPVVIECECPVWPFSRPLQITVAAADGAAIKTHTVEQQGRFALTFRMPDRSAGNRVVLLANQSFVPRRLGFSDDSRVLSFRILDVNRLPAGAPAAAQH